MKQSRRSIRTQLVAYGVSLTALALAILMLGTLAYNTWDKYRALSGAMHVGADVIGRNSAAAILFGDEADAAEVLSSLAAAPDILHATVLLPDGTRLADYHSQAGLGCRHGIATVSVVPESSSLQFSWCSVQLHKPIVLHGQRIGSVALEYSLAPLFSSILFELLFGILAILLTLLLSLLIWRRFATRITLPLFHLSRVTQQVSQQQDFSLRAVVASNDEVGRLASDFNGMMDQLQRYDVRLKEELRQRRAAEARLNQLAYHDSVTGLHNRHFFKERLDEVIDQACRHGDGCAVLMIDLDGFKKINDTLGHDMGDELLRQVASRLRNGVRDSDIACRLGGDEFAIIARGDATRDQIQQLAQGLVELMAPAYQLQGKRVFVTGSIGASLCPEHAADKELLVKYADIAMYQAKEKGKNGYSIYRPESATYLDNLFRIENDLHEALVSNQLQLHYQPRYTTADRKLVGFEALLRWDHPELGQIAPAQFIPVAENTELILPIGEWILQQASQRLAEWKRIAPGLKLSLNLSGQQLKHDEAIEGLVSILRASTLSRGDIELELTESSLLEITEVIRVRMQRLLESGFLLALDGFSAGYSSLSYLHSFPFTRIKIARSFIEQLSPDPGSQALVSAMVAIGETLGLDITAQGVEYAEQLDILATIGCSQAQGLYLGEPMSADATRELIEQAYNRSLINPRS
ncbi:MULTISPECIES: EAL domain-containing protein [Halomonadaceae]|jgi:diguanylate cyclase (GGDEF)-like protein|nr:MULTISPECIES: EAL domain-containing protein [Halomonas]MCE8033654.1 EAL domain-containing protein [Halomonas sp. MCCC 1A11057]